MNDSNYSKFKDASPADTVYRIRNILYEMGIMTIDTWGDSGIEGCFSLRVTIAGTSLGANGKGTEPLYALASGYAELIERLQNGILYLGDLSDEAINHAGFLKAPDEKYYSYPEIAAMDNAMLKYIFSRILDSDWAGRNISSTGAGAVEYPEIDGGDKLETIKAWTVFNPPGNPSNVVTIPFYSVKTSRVQYLLYDMYSSIYGSNGMCAGNTPEEALVQGLSEVFERYVNKELISGKITPPTIPDDYLMNYPDLFRIIQNIRQGGRYRVIVKDCSLGKHYPVVGTIIIDTFRGTFGMKLGVHPSFPIALERTITEAFQGGNIETFTGSCKIGFEDEALNHRDNPVNIAKVGVGQYPVQLLFDKFSYEFEPFMGNQAKPNKEMLSGMVKLVVEQGYDLLIRDVSFLGFPSYQIIVPGFSEMYPVDLLRARELKTYTAMGKTIANLAGASIEELERMVRYIRYKRYSFIENQMNMIIQRPLLKTLPGGNAEVDFFMGVCLYKLGRLEEACKVLRNIGAAQARAADDEHCYYSCMADYIKAKSTGLAQEEIRAILQELYPEKIARRVVYQLQEPEKVFDRIYPGFNCWDCENCNTREYCCYRETEKVLKVLKERYAGNPINQEKLAKIFADVPFTG